MACIVRGSVNVDDFFTVSHIVRPGETISSEEYSQRIGGKGANCSVAIAKAGTPVQFIGNVGDDALAERVIDTLKGYGVGVDQLGRAKGLPTGKAIIQLSKNDGENSIVLLKGANYGPEIDVTAALTKDDKEEEKYIIVQNEIPLQETIKALECAARSSNSTTIFNPSPMPSEQDILNTVPWDKIDWLIVNQGEACDLLKVIGAQQSKKLVNEENDNDEDYTISENKVKFINKFSSLDSHPLASSIRGGIIITFGGQGVAARVNTQQQQQSSSTFSSFALGPGKLSAGGVKDTTGAGDCFTGYFSSCLSKISQHRRHKQYSENTEDYINQIKQAVTIASQAGAICAGSYGAMEAVPVLEDVNNYMAETPEWLL